MSHDIGLEEDGHHAQDNGEGETAHDDAWENERILQRKAVVGGYLREQDVCMILEEAALG